jgi:hypothetical protein
MKKQLKLFKAFKKNNDEKQELYEKSKIEIKGKKKNILFNFYHSDTDNAYYVRPDDYRSQKVYFEDIPFIIEQLEILYYEEEE